MSESANVDLSIDQGADFSLQIYWTDAGNNPFTVLHPMRMDIRSKQGAVIHSLTTLVSGDDQPDILYNSDSGLIQLTIRAQDTADFPPGQYDYDLFVSHQDDAVGEVRLKRLIRGNVLVYGRVTKEM